MARDVSRHLRRLARLEATFGHRDCICMDHPPVLIVLEQHRSEDAIDAEVARRQPRCPVHGLIGDVVTIRQFGSGPENCACDACR